MLNDELERIYREANGIPDGKRAPLTTEAVFKAMRAAIAAEREACAKLCDNKERDARERLRSDMAAGVAYLIGAAIRARSNAPAQRRP